MASNLESSLAAKGSDTIWDFSCDACNENEAQFYCKGCSKCFCENCVKLHNQLFSSHSLFGRERMEKWPISKPTLDILEKCAEHSDKIIQLFCEDHIQLCCLVCVAHYHRSCSKVRLIEEINKYSTADAYELSSNIQKIQEELMNLKEKANGNLLSLEMTYQRIKEEIDTVRQKINKELDRLERATMQEVHTLISSSTKNLTKERDKCDSIQERMQCLSKEVNEVCNKSSKLLFIALEKCQHKIKDSELFIKESKVTREYGIEFSPINDIEKYLFKLAGLGRVGPPNKIISLQKKSEYGVKMSTELSTCYIYAICELPTGETLLLDYNNNKVNILDQKYQCLSYCEVSSNSYEMCVVSSSEVVVTTNTSGVFGQHGLQMINVCNGRLGKGWKLQLPHRCVGIVHHEDALYVTFGRALFQYTLTGTLVKKLFEDTKGDNTVYKCAVNLVGDKIYVTNMDNDTLLTLTMDGTVISTFSDIDLKDPRGVHIAPGGQVLVCCYRSNTIIQVDFEGKKKLATLATKKDGIRDPCSVFYSSITDSVIVGLANNAIIVLKVT